MRENIADMLNVSSAQIGKIENIKHNAIPDVEKTVKSGEMSISTAQQLMRSPNSRPNSKSTINILNTNKLITHQSNHSISRACARMMNDRIDIQKKSGKS